MSLSYLSGLPKTTYMNFLEDTKKYLPMLNPYSYMDWNKVWHWRENKTEATPYLERYHHVQHYVMHDRKKRY